MFLHFSASPVAFHYDPSTTARISHSPHHEDPYEKAHVYVMPSKISPEAGEGLYARKAIKKGQLVCLFNGIRRRKEGRGTKPIGANDDEWSDYRLTLGNSNRQHAKLKS